MSRILISHELCPFVQRSVITLLEKEVEFEQKFVDLDNPPQWFLDISPLGKVPILQVNGEILFESAVINEYLDEVTPPTLHPSDPLLKAINRAWIEFASDLIVTMYMISVADSEDMLDQQTHLLYGKLDTLEKQLATNTPFFNGADFSLVDAAFAPALLRIQLLDKHLGLDAFDGRPAVLAWTQRLVNRDSVKNSLTENFETKFLDYSRTHSEYIRERLA
ncbi:MAG: glutathione S-transferase family protein, partial [Gammaproteobacteria bacterium]|nr:glutathione S-transferase family protein [Gammaproteobacteria bacterium]MDH5693786.1 glutathione S-transferase family protein [Gammaproteobacteria bacterium]